MLTVLGLPIKIEWDQLEVKGSFFVPCLDSAPVAAFIKSEGARRGYKMICKQVVEKGRYGLRAWRTG
jgi:hypothetical protein